MPSRRELLVGSAKVAGTLAMSVGGNLLTDGLFHRPSGRETVLRPDPVRLTISVGGLMFFQDSVALMRRPAVHVQTVEVVEPILPVRA
jgi:hypothetical protein